MPRHSEDHLAALRTRIVTMMREETGGNEQEAMRMTARIMTAMLQEYSGQEVYFRTPETYSAPAVLADIDAGQGRREVCRRHGISRSTYYRLIHRSRTQVAK